MKTAVVLTIILGAALAAPVEDSQLEVQREKKAAYGQAGPGYGSPCSGGQALAPIALYLSPQSPGLGLNPHYRADEHSEDKEEARSYYDTPAAPAGALASASSNLAYGKGLAGPAVGLFPNAKVGGCAVPLLLSCAPSVTSGHLASSGAAGYGAGAAAYRAPAHEDHHKEREAPEQAWTPERAWNERANLEIKSEHKESDFETPKMTLNKFSSA